MDFTAFMENLKTNEMEIKAKEDREPQKKINVALKASIRELKKKIVVIPITSDDEQDDDEEPTLLVKNMRRM